MNRRAFLASLLASATLDPERLLWRPGAKLISIPKRWGIYGLAGQFMFPMYDVWGALTGDLAWFKVWDDGRVVEQKVPSTHGAKTRQELDMLSVPIASFPSIRHMESGVYIEDPRC